MNRSLRSEARAVSPVVGVVLMVGITVVLMGAVGAFVLNAGPGTSPPDADFVMTEFENNSNTTVDIRYAGGGDDVVLKENVEVIVDGEQACDGPDGEDQVEWNDGSGAFDIGDSVEVVRYGQDCDDELDPGNVVRVIWTSDDGTTSTILADHEIRN